MPDIFDSTHSKLLSVSLILILLLSACGPAGQTSICHATGDPANPYEEVTVDMDGLSEHESHEGDFWPVPASGCPTTTVLIVDGKITICHATSSETNPYEQITVDAHGLNGHDDHENDIIPAPAEGCPTSMQ